MTLEQTASCSLSLKFIRREAAWVCTVFIAGIVHPKMIVIY